MKPKTSFLLAAVMTFLIVGAVRKLSKEPSQQEKRRRFYRKVMRAQVSTADLVAEHLSDVHCN